MQKKSHLDGFKKTKKQHTLLSNLSSLKKALSLILLFCTIYQTPFFTTNSRFALNSPSLAEKTISNHAFNTHQHYIIALSFHKVFRLTLAYASDSKNQHVPSQNVTYIHVSTQNYPLTTNENIL